MNSNSIFDTVFSASADAIYAVHGTQTKYRPLGVDANAVFVSMCVDETNALNVSDQQTFDAPEIADSASQFDRIVASLRMSEVAVLRDGDTVQIGSGPILSVLPSTITNDGTEWSFEAVHKRPETNLFDLDGQRAIWGDED